MNIILYCEELAISGVGFFLVTWAAVTISLVLLPSLIAGAGDLMIAVGVVISKNDQWIHRGISFFSFLKLRTYTQCFFDFSYM